MQQERQQLTPVGYRPRLIEERLDVLMRGFGCVEITGPKWCGKTWTALSRCASVSKLDVRPEREAAQVDPSLALLGDTPHLVDEWQEVPEVWDAARRFVDDSGNRRGLLLLTGSTCLRKDERDRLRHSGAGRIARLTMRPMTLAETGDSTAEVSLRSLFGGMPTFLSGGRRGSETWHGGVVVVGGRQTWGLRTTPPWRLRGSTYRPFWT